MDPKTTLEEEQSIKRYILRSKPEGAYLATIYAQRAVPTYDPRCVHFWIGDFIVGSVDPIVCDWVDSTGRVTRKVIGVYEEAVM